MSSPSLSPLFEASPAVEETTPNLIDNGQCVALGTRAQDHRLHRSSVVGGRSGLEVDPAFVFSPRPNNGPRLMFLDPSEIPFNEAPEGDYEEEYEEVITEVQDTATVAFSPTSSSNGVNNPQAREVNESLLIKSGVPQKVSDRQVGPVSPDDTDNEAIFGGSSSTGVIESTNEFQRILPEPRRPSNRKKQRLLNSTMADVTVYRSSPLMAERDNQQHFSLSHGNNNDRIISQHVEQRQQQDSQYDSAPPHFEREIQSHFQQRTQSSPESERERKKLPAPSSNTPSSQFRQSDPSPILQAKSMPPWNDLPMEPAAVWTTKEQLGPRGSQHHYTKPLHHHSSLIDSPRDGGDRMISNQNGTECTGIYNGHIGNTRVDITEGNNRLTRSTNYLRQHNRPEGSISGTYSDQLLSEWGYLWAWIRQRLGQFFIQPLHALSFGIHVMRSFSLSTIDVLRFLLLWCFPALVIWVLCVCICCTFFLCCYGVIYYLVIPDRLRTFPVYFDYHPNPDSLLNPYIPLPQIPTTTSNLSPIPTLSPPPVFVDHAHHSSSFESFDWDHNPKSVDRGASTRKSASSITSSPSPDHSSWISGRPSQACPVQPASQLSPDQSMFQEPSHNSLMTNVGNKGLHEGRSPLDMRSEMPIMKKSLTTPYTEAIMLMQTESPVDSEVLVDNSINRCETRSQMGTQKNKAQLHNNVCGKESKGRRSGSYDGSHGNVGDAAEYGHEYYDESFPRHRKPQRPKRIGGDATENSEPQRPGSQHGYRSCRGDGSGIRNDWEDETIRDNNRNAAVAFITFDNRTWESSPKGISFKEYCIYLHQLLRKGNGTITASVLSSNDKPDETMKSNTLILGYNTDVTLVFQHVPYVRASRRLDQYIYSTSSRNSVPSSKYGSGNTFIITHPYGHDFMTNTYYPELYQHPPHPNSNEYFGHRGQDNCDSNQVHHYASRSPIYEQRYTASPFSFVSSFVVMFTFDLFDSKCTRVARSIRPHLVFPRSVFRNALQSIINSIPALLYSGQSTIEGRVTLIEGISNNREVELKLSRLIMSPPLPISRAQLVFETQLVGVRRVMRDHRFLSFFVFVSVTTFVTSPLLTCCCFAAYARSMRSLPAPSQHNFQNRQPSHWSRLPSKTQCERTRIRRLVP